MVKVLVAVGDSCRIEKISMNESGLELEEGQDILEWFPIESRQKIEEKIRWCRVTEGSETITTQLNLDGDSVVVSLYVLSLGQRVSLLMLDHTALSIRGHDECLVMYNEYVNLMREEFRKQIRREEKPESEIYEEIQHLNNELINTRRSLEKSNRKLNQMNEALEGRLVKDALTGLISKYQYWREVERTIHQASDKKGVFVFIDMDGFKTVNDTFGHAAGDQFLVAFAKRLMTVGSTEDLKIRIAGDEFALYSHGFNEITEEILEGIWEELKEKALKDPIVINDVAIPISISCGMAVFGEDTRNINQLIEYADFAMYQAKKSGKGRFTRFSKKEYQQHTNQEDRLQELKEIISTKDIHHVYQPFVEAKTGEIAGYSVQLRTTSHLFQDTSDLLSFAYETGLYRELDKASIQKLQMNSQLRENIQGKQLVITHGPYPITEEAVLSLIENTFEGIQVVLEIWLPVTIEPKEMLKIREQSHKVGWKIALANFGVSHFNNLQMLAIKPDLIRFNKEVMRKAMSDKGIETVIRSTIKYCQGQGTKTLGDFVENKKHQNFYHSLGLDYLQGFYLSYAVDQPQG